MRMHPTLVEHIVLMCKNYGGHTNETKLAKLFDEMRVTPYVRQANMASDAIVLVDYTRYVLERSQQRMSTDDIVPAKFHNTALHQMMEIYKSYSGYEFEGKLKRAFFNLDFTPYTSKTTGESFFVLTKDFMETLRQS